MLVHSESRPYAKSYGFFVNSSELWLDGKSDVHGRERAIWELPSSSPINNEVIFGRSRSESKLTFIG